MADLHKHEVDNLSNSKHDITTVEVLRLDADGDDTRLPLVDLIDDLQQALAAIAPEFRDSAVLRIRGYGDYATADASVEYRRPETDAEFVDRQRWLKSIASDDEERDRREFARLKAKFATS